MGRFFPDAQAGRYDYHQEAAHILMKVETHNHPTAISPWPGAATGYFRTYEERVDSHNGVELRGYHKPVMLAGGIGNIRTSHVQKGEINVSAKIDNCSGRTGDEYRPWRRCGVFDGLRRAGQSDAHLDFASVQRDNPEEMKRSCQEVIDCCWQRNEENPILFIHDVGTGGLSNAMPELVSDGGRGGRFQLREIPNDEPGMSPLEVWCNESQERYVMAVAPERLAEFWREFVGFIRLRADLRI